MKKGTSAEFEAIFARLRAILQKHKGGLTVRQDTDTCFSLEGGLHPTHKKPMPIAWVEIGKAYVSYHHMAVYARPQVLEDFSTKLRARMQGKSCFNFKTVDEDLFEELEKLTVAGFAAFRKAGFMK